MHWTENAVVPKVSVLMVTYNHERYIQQAVESALSQVTTFPVEIVIGEDCSTDCTRDILLELQKTHPNSIRLFSREKNIGPQANHAATFAACRGDFVAMLEGDDYWTDVTKLQKQVEALESHPHWSMCFHITRRVYEDGSREPELYPPDWDRDEATIDDLFNGNFCNTCSVVFRNRLFGLMPEWHLQILPGDWATSILNADCGPIGFVPGIMADYRIHAQGIWAQKSNAFQLQEILRFLSHVDYHFKGKYREQIDAYRINLVSSLANQIDVLKEQMLASVEASSALFPRSSLGTPSCQSPLTIPIAEPLSESVTPISKRRSPAIELVRKVMRPMENAVRRSKILSVARRRMKSY